MGDSICFFCAGEPVPQGSLKAFIIKGKARLVHSNSRLEGWRQRIAHEAQAKAAEVGWTYGLEEAYEVQAYFRFTVPKSYPKKWWFQHTKYPDLDRLVRALDDALTGILFDDDARVTDLHVGKGYCVLSEGMTPGVEVTVIRKPGKVPR